MIIPVTILLFYPYWWFQRLLTCFPSRWYLVLQAFVDSFQGCFKNGTEQGKRSRDYRSFAGLYFILRVVTLLVYVFTLQATFYIICGILFLLFSVLLLTLRPYKPEVSWYTNLNAVFIILIATLWFSLTGLSYAPHLRTLFLIFALFCWITPMIYSLYCVLRWCFFKRKKTKTYVASLLSWLHIHSCSSDDDKEESLPHRIVHSASESYQTITD